MPGRFRGRLMNRFVTFVFAALFSAAVLTAAPPARASLSDALSDMLAATATNPGVYQSQRRGVLTGGSFQVRWPIRNIWLAHIAPPHLQAGCNGIDFFGGSFSFINAEQFKQILRQIGTAAVGYAFQLAIATICQECASLMAHLQDLMNNINSLEASSCAIGAKIVAGLASNMDLSSAGKAELRKIEQAAGGADDFVDALTKMFTDPGWGSDATSYAVQAANSTGDYGGAAMIGNITYRALYKDATVAKLGGILSGSSSGRDTATIETLISLVGTIIYPEDPKNSPDQGGCNASPSNQETECTPTPYHRTLSLQNLMWAKSNDSTVAPHTILRCNNLNGIRGCLSMYEGTFPLHTLDQIVHNHLFGTYDLSVAVGQPGSIVYRIQNGQELTTTQQAFIGITTIPLLRILVDVHRSPEAVALFARAVEKDFVRLMALRLATAISLTVNTAFSGDKDKPPMPDIVKEGLLALARETSDVQAKEALSSPDATNALIELAKNIKGSFPKDHKPAEAVQ